MAANRPQVCFCSIAFRDEPIVDIVPRLAKLGYDGVEVWGKHIDGQSEVDLRTLRRVADDAGIRLAVLSPYFWLTRDLPDLIRESHATAARFSDYARILGAQRIRTFVDAGNDGIGSAEATDEHWARAVDNLQRIAAAAPDLLFPVETHPHTLADTPESMLRLRERVAQPNLVVLYQPDGGDPMPGYRLLQPWIRHLHLQNPHVGGAPGYLEEGDSPLPPLLAALREDGYAETLSVEYCWRGATWDHAQRARAWLRSHGI
jgi:3-dehydroshikimate dehydratase